MDLFVLDRNTVRGVFLEVMQMKILPSLEEARRYAASGAYRVLPLRCEMPSDRLSPIECLRILKGVSAHCYLPESAEDRGGFRAPEGISGMHQQGKSGDECP